MSVLNCLPPAAAQTPAAATDAVATLAAATDGSAWIIDGIAYSYSATPTGGELDIAWGSNTIRLYISAGGPGFFNFAGMGMKFPANTQVTITLKSGAGAVVGSVYPFGRRS